MDKTSTSRTIKTTNHHTRNNRKWHCAAPLFACKYKLCFARTEYCWKIAVDWYTPTMGIEPTAPPLSHSAVRRTNHCATGPFPKKNGLNAVYIMHRLPRHGSLARCYHHRCPTLVPLKTALLLQPCRLHLQPS